MAGGLAGRAVGFGGGQLWRLIVGLWPLWIWGPAPWILDFFLDWPEQYLTPVAWQTLLHVAAPVMLGLVAVVAYFAARAGRFSVYVCAGMQLWESGKLLLSQPWTPDRQLELQIALGAAGAALFLVAFAFQPPGHIASVLRAWWRRGQDEQTWQHAAEDTQGSARFRKPAEALKALGEGGIVLASSARTTKPADIAAAPLYRATGDRHVLVVGGSGSGKSVSFAIPTLLSLDKGVVVLDPKGELYASTADLRRARFGQSVAQVGPGYGSLNVMSTLDPTSDYFSEDVVALAHALVPEPDGGAGDNKYFLDGARAIVAAVIMDVMTAPAEIYPVRDLRAVHEILTAPFDKLSAYLEILSTCGENPKIGDRGQWNGPIRTTVGSFVGMEPKELLSISSTATSSMQWLSTPSLATAVSGGDKPVDIAPLLQSRMSLYVSIPAETLASSPGVARSIFSVLFSCFSRRARRYVAELGKEAADARLAAERVVFLIDETPLLRKFEPLAQALGFARGLGVTCIPVVQGLSQLKKWYGEPGMEEFLDNCVLKLVLGTAEKGAAEYFSALAGEATVLQQTANAGGSGGVAQGGSSLGDGVSHVKRPLLTPHEVLTLDKYRCLIFEAGEDVLRATKAYYRHLPGLTDLPEPAEQAALAAPVPLLAPPEDAWDDGAWEEDDQGEAEGEAEEGDGATDQAEGAADQAEGATDQGEGQEAEGEAAEGARPPRSPASTPPAVAEEESQTEAADLAAEQAGEGQEEDGFADLADLAADLHSATGGAPALDLETLAGLSAEDLAAMAQAQDDLAGWTPPGPVGSPVPLDDLPDPEDEEDDEPEKKTG